ncbi:MAG: hypothetical protein ACM31C_15400 [Acidobacteriota bacterium]
MIAASTNTPGTSYLLYGPPSGSECDPLTGIIHITGLNPNQSVEATATALGGLAGCDCDIWVGSTDTGELQLSGAGPDYICSGSAAQADTSGVFHINATMNENAGNGVVHGYNVGIELVLK